MKSLFFAILAIASFSADSFGQTMINSVPYTISAPGNYVLGSNLTYSSAAGAAITILSSNVTLDLAGHYLYFPGTPTSNVGVYVHNAGNVIIQNGIIAVFHYGIYIEHTGGTALNTGDIVENLRLTNVNDGVVLITVAGSIVRNNQITSTLRRLRYWNRYLRQWRQPGQRKCHLWIRRRRRCVRAIIISSRTWLAIALFGFLLDATDKYRFNTTFDCTTPFSGGTALTDNNN